VHGRIRFFDRHCRICLTAVGSIIAAIGPSTSATATLRRNARRGATFTEG
jgi:hypothetical protein